MTRWYPMGVVASILFDRKLTHIALDDWRGANDLCNYLGATPETVRQTVLEIYPYLEIDTAGVDDWSRFVHQMRSRFGCQVEFDKGYVA